MLLSEFAAAVRKALREDLGSGWEVCQADDDWSAIQLLAGSSPQSFRVVLQSGKTEAIRGSVDGSLCEVTTSLMVQQRRGLTFDAGEITEAQLMDAEEAVRILMLSYLFRPPAAQEFTMEHISRNETPHQTCSQFTFAGSDIYTPPVEDVILEHPARTLRFTNYVALSSPAAPRVIDLTE